MARNRLYDDDVLVIGLGRFGGAAAAELKKLGHKVVAVEMDPELADAFQGKLDKVITADAGHPSIIERTRARGLRLAVVAIGSSVEASVLAASNLVEAGVEQIWAKALSADHAKILERIGVHHVVRPEADSGKRVAHLVNGKMEDYIEFDDGFAIVKMHPPRETIGFTLQQSAIRSKYGVTVVGVKSPGEDFTHAVPSTKVADGDVIIVSGPTKLIENLAARP
ncbi:potassium channel family protein [Actinomycetota bacterium]